MLATKKSAVTVARDLSDLLQVLAMDLQGVWSIEHDLRYAEGKIMALENIVAKLEVKVAKLEKAVANGGKVATSGGDCTQTDFNALYDVHGC